MQHKIYAYVWYVVGGVFNRSFFAKSALPIPRRADIPVAKIRISDVTNKETLGSWTLAFAGMTKAEIPSPPKPLILNLWKHAYVKHGVRGSTS